MKMGVSGEVQTFTIQVGMRWLFEADLIVHFPFSIATTGFSVFATILLPIDKKKITIDVPVMAFLFLDFLLYVLSTGYSLKYPPGTTLDDTLIVLLALCGCCYFVSMYGVKLALQSETISGQTGSQTN